MYRSSLGGERSSISIMGVCREEGGIAMKRLTQKDEQGNWSLRGVPWEQLHEGQIITKDLYERVYGALWKLMEYEDTGLSPEELERVNDFGRSQAGKLLKELNEEQCKHRWIPVEERLPEVPEGTEDDYCPEFNVMIKGAVQATTLKFAPDGTWFDDFGQVYSVIAWQPLPEPYRRE